MELRQLDRRFAGHEMFTHRIEFTGRYHIDQFLRVRNWCFNTFGVSAEIGLLCSDVFEETPTWAWNTDNGYKIFIRGPALSQFLMIKEKFEL